MTNHLDYENNRSFFCCTSTFSKDNSNLSNYNVHIAKNPSLKRFLYYCTISFVFYHISTLTLVSGLKELIGLNDNHPLFELPISKCNKTHADQNVRWLYFFNDPDRLVPDNQKGFEQFCNQTMQKELYVKEYARRCLAKFPKQVTSLLMFGIIRKNRQLCSKTKLRKEMIHAAKCLNVMKPKGSKCFQKAIQDFLLIKHLPVRTRPGKTCCVYYQLEECLVQQVIDTPDVCAARDAQIIENLIEGYTGQVVSSICQNYPKSHDVCTKIVPKNEMTRLKKLISVELNRTYSILPPLIAILDSIPP